jgi:hypothetical protein
MKEKNLAVSATFFNKFLKGIHLQAFKEQQKNCSP